MSVKLNVSNVDFNKRDGTKISLNTIVDKSATEAIKEIETKGQEVLQSIPQDFTTQMQSKLDKNQGAENKDKILGIGADGLVIPVEKTGVTEEQINNAVNDYLIKNPVSPTKIDTTLTMSGQAADAKIVGDKFKNTDIYLDSTVKNFVLIKVGKNIFNSAINKSGYYDRFNNGIFTESSNFICCPDAISIKPNTKLYYYNSDSNADVVVLLYKNGNYVTNSTFSKGKNSYITVGDIDEIRLYAVKAWNGKLAIGYETFSNGYEPYTKYYSLNGEKIENNTIGKEKLNKEYSTFLDESTLKINLISERFYKNFLYKSTNVIDENAMTKGTVDYATGEIKLTNSSTNLISKDFIVLPNDVTTLYFISENARNYGSFVLWYNDVSYLGYESIFKNGDTLFSDSDIKSGATKIKIVKHMSDPQICLTFTKIDSFISYKEEAYLNSKIEDNLIEERCLSLNIREKLKIGIHAQKFHGKKCVFLGDSIIDGYGMPVSLRIPQLVGELSGMTVYNLGVGGTRGGKHQYENYQAFSFYELANAITSTDYTKQEQQADSVGKSAPTMVKLLKTIDFSTIDYMVISYGTNDWISSNTVNVETKDYTSFYYAMTQGINTIREAYPKIKILLCTPIFRSAFGTKEQGYSDSYIHDGNSLKLIDFVECVKDIGRKCHVPVCDNYYNANIDAYNCDTYLSDGTHPFVSNGDGTILLASRIYSQIETNF